MTNISDIVSSRSWDRAHLEIGPRTSAANAACCICGIKALRAEHSSILSIASTSSFYRIDITVTVILVYKSAPRRMGSARCASNSPRCVGSSKADGSARGVEHSASRADCASGRGAVRTGGRSCRSA